MADRLEDAVETCQSMERDAEGALQPLEELFARTATVADTLQAEGERTRADLEAASELLAQIRADIGEAGQDARNEVQGLGARAGELGEQATTALEEVGERLAELDAQRLALIGTLDSGLELSSAEAQAVGARVRSLQSEIQAGIEAALEGVNALRASVAGGRQRLAEARQSLGASLETLESTAHERARGVGEEIMAALQMSTTEVFESMNTMIEEHNAAMQDLWEGLAVEVPDQLSSGLETLAEALDGTAEMVSGLAETLIGDGGQLGDLLDGLAEALSGVRGAVSQAAARVPNI